jgi:hypothetical protein
MKPGRSIEFKTQPAYSEMPMIYVFHNTTLPPLKVPKREIFDRSDFPDFYTIKSSWVGDLLVKILTYYLKFLRELSRI